MAVDTRNKRFSLMGIAQPWLLTLPYADGTPTVADGYQYDLAYRGFADDAAGGGPTSTVVMQPMRLMGPI